ncbi:MAG: DUF3276 family protein [Bacteroidetes bacterium]|nr:DUF3276 family protein [Bacteroidota bacterium]
MEDIENKDRDREEIFSRTVRAGKRTYFFDVKSTIGDEFYLTITESKRRFNNEQGRFFYEKHKLFLYKEDFDKFSFGLSDAIEFIKTGKAPDRPVTDFGETEIPAEIKRGDKHTDISFEDLASGSEEEIS